MLKDEEPPSIITEININNQPWTEVGTTPAFPPALFHKHAEANK
jgi:hypothetical protein